MTFDLSLTGKQNALLASFQPLLADLQREAGQRGYSNLSVAIQVENGREAFGVNVDGPALLIAPRFGFVVIPGIYTRPGGYFLLGVQKTKLVLSDNSELTYDPDGKHLYTVRSLIVATLEKPKYTVFESKGDKVLGKPGPCLTASFYRQTEDIYFNNRLFDSFAEHFTYVYYRHKHCVIFTHENIVGGLMGMA